MSGCAKHGHKYYIFFTRALYFVPFHCCKVYQFQNPAQSCSKVQLVEKIVSNEHPTSWIIWLGKGKVFMYIQLSPAILRFTSFHWYMIYNKAPSVLNFIYVKNWEIPIFKFFELQCMEHIVFT